MSKIFLQLKHFLQFKHAKIDGCPGRRLASLNSDGLAVELLSFPISSEVDRQRVDSEFYSNRPESVYYTPPSLPPPPHPPPRHRFADAAAEIEFRIASSLSDRQHRCRKIRKPSVLIYDFALLFRKRRICRTNR